LTYCAKPGVNKHKIENSVKMIDLCIP
jgi:hypothetical protein